MTLVATETLICRLHPIPIQGSRFMTGLGHMQLPGILHSFLWMM